MTKYKLAQLAEIKYGKDHKKLGKGSVPVYGTGGIMRYANNFIYEGESVLIPRKGSLNNLFYVNGKFWTVDTIFWTKINSKIVLPRYLYYYLSKIDLTSYNVGSAVPSLTISLLNELVLDIPPISVQKDVVKKLIVIENKIELNKQINDNLDELSTVIFDRWIRNSSSDVKCPLDHVAKYTNGLAMQKFRPQNNEIGLPVVKIRELNQGDIDENSDYCTSNIDQSVKVNTGDIIFSWSGTLTLDIWAGGEAGLNQHLFKVTSSKYPYWFVFEWTKYYLKSFQNIAKSKATTMGHIKRSDLHSSLVKIPTHDEMIELNTTLSPMYSQKIAIRHENRVLYQMKQQLLSKYF